MRPILSTLLSVALTSVATGALAQTYQSYGDAREGGYSYAYGDPNAPGGYVEEQEYHRADYPPPQAYYPPQPAHDYGYAQGGYVQGGYAQAPCSTCGGPVGGYEVPTYGYASQNYGWPGAMCGCGGELSYGYMGSEGYYGGVGGPASYGYSGGYGGGGYVYSGGGAGGYGRSWSSSSASASARAYSSSSTSIRVGGGYHGGGKGHGGKGY